jgi:23S rRNA pseudouridine2605 synthase
MRLAKYLAHAGVASRRAAEEIVRAGRVTIGAETVTDPARDVSETDAVAVDGEPVRNASERLVYALHKPRGVVSTASDTHGRQTVVDLVPGGRRVYPVGRLDVNTSGLILLTDDGELANLLTHPRHEVTKTYRATVAGPAVTDTALRRLRAGVQLDDGPTLPARVRRLGPNQLELTLREGRKRQVRRMCEAVGHPVRDLTRVALGPLQLGSLRPREYRVLGPEEIAALRAAARI